MAFRLKWNSEPPDIRDVRFAIERAIYNSRFTAKVDIKWSRSSKQRSEIVINEVRLRQKKGYCGNHPGPCLLNRPHKKMDFLEGLDWVEWNDMLNDVMDQLNVDADCASSLVIIRKGKARCIHYTAARPGVEWDKDSGRFEDWCGKQAPRAKCMDGTPGGEEEAKIQERLEYLRGELRSERISTGELVELQSLADHIDEHDVELLERERGVA